MLDLSPAVLALRADMIADPPPDLLALAAEMIALRRGLPQDPELAYGETRTAARGGAFLGGRGLEGRRGGGGSGLLATAEGEGGRTVLLRVDLDALPIQEQTGARYASQTPGLMHACGHDGHTAMGAAAARILGRRRGPGSVRVLFQPAEEGEGGAQAVVADGVLDGVDLVLGVHLWNELPVGTLGVKPGALMAAVDRLKIVIHGRGGHGGQPHRSADPVVAAAPLVTPLQTLLSPQVSPPPPVPLPPPSIPPPPALNLI